MDTIKDYEKFKKDYEEAARNGSILTTNNTVELLKRNACLVEIIYGAKSLAEDIFANAVQIEKEMGK